MISSQARSTLSGNGSTAGNNAGHGSVVIGSGLRPGSVRAGQAVSGVNDCAGAVGRPGKGAGMLGGNGPGVGSRGGVRPGNGTGLTTLQSVGQGGLVGLNTGVGIPGSGRYDPDKECAPVCSGSDAESDSGDDDDPMSSVGDNRRGVKRERAEMEAAMVGPEIGVQPGGYGVVTGGVAGAKPGKKTRGRVKIKMEFIDNKLRRYTTFSKRKTGIMKKAYELSTLTGTQVLLLVASETGHVYTFATRKLQPMITSETGKALIQTCLNSPDSPPRSDPSTDQRMSATGFEETDLTYQVSESESLGETKICQRVQTFPEVRGRASPLQTPDGLMFRRSSVSDLQMDILRVCTLLSPTPTIMSNDTLKPAFTVASLPGNTSTSTTTSTSMQASSSSSFPITNYLAPISAGNSGGGAANGTLLKTAGAPGGVMQLPSGFTFMSAGTPFPPGTPAIPLGSLQQHSLAIQGQQGPAIAATAAQTQTQQGQQAVFRLPAAVSLTGGAMSQQLQAIQVHPTTQSSSISCGDNSPEISQATTTATVSLPATIVTSSVPTSMAGHMMYPSPHTVMYASAPTLADGGLAVLNAFSQGPSAMQVSHSQGQDSGAVPQVFLTAPPGTVQIPVSAVQLHPVRQDLHFTSETPNILSLCATSMLMPATKALRGPNGRARGGAGLDALFPALPTGAVWSLLEIRWPEDKDNLETLHAHQNERKQKEIKALGLWQTVFVICERGLSKCCSTSLCWHSPKCHFVVLSL
ncbi:serum response factor-like isoform X2 [Alosa alosa]|uniref:serum response factor-like isoform X2 n=1 Tax=Alosa alosa TaxID=278164 RepID=UPI0020153694|nr:serum response factor-like isoform X2 [Alosa alosa]